MIGVSALVIWCLTLSSFALRVPLEGEIAARASHIDTTSGSQHQNKHHKKVGGYTAKGCYSGFFLSSIHIQNSSVTPKFCSRFCDAYPFFSLENGNECQCGNSKSGLSKAPKTSCNSPCVGNSKKICGGFSRKDIYHNAHPKAKPARIPGRFALLGCYSGGVLDGPGFGNSSNSVEFCATFCKGYLYMALENGNQCSCGNTTPDETPQTSCGTGCAANGEEFCGGFGQKNLYMS